MSKRKTPAEQLGIVIGKTVVREDWRCSSPEFNRPPEIDRRYRSDAYCTIPLMGQLIIRDNHITLSAGSTTAAPVFELWSVEQPPELLAA